MLLGSRGGGAGGPGRGEAQVGVSLVRSLTVLPRAQGTKHTTDTTCTSRSEFLADCPSLSPNTPAKVPPVII